MPLQDNMQPGADQEVLEDRRLAEPDRYRVIMHNDDFTSMEFVVGILKAVFHKNPEEANTVMLAVHHQGVAQCGIYTREIAEAKISRVHRDARKAGFPLKCSMEKA